MTHIMVKTFYVIVSFYAIEAKNEGMFTKFKNSFFAKTSQKERTETFLQKKNQLWQRVEFVQQTLQSTGVRLAPLKTQELIELYYSLYNPGLAEKIETVNVENLDIQ